MDNTIIEIIATVLGLVQGVLVWMDKRSNWIAYCLQYVFMTVFSINAHLYGDITNCIIYFIIGVFGWFMWNNKSTKPIRYCSSKERILYALVFVVSSAILYFVLKQTNDPLPLLDAFTTAGGYVATYYMLTRKVDTWILWFIIDVLYIIEYYMLPDQAWYLMGLNLIWTFMAVGSFLTWNKKAKEALKQ